MWESQVQILSLRPFTSKSKRFCTPAMRAVRIGTDIGTEMRGPAAEKEGRFRGGFLTWPTSKSSPPAAERIPLTERISRFDGRDITVYFAGCCNLVTAILPTPLLKR